MIDGVSVGEVRPGYELWRPNREKADSVTTKIVTVILLAATSIIAIIVAITGFSLMSGGTGMAIMTLIYGLLYAFFAFLVLRWNRGILPVIAALAIILGIFAAVSAPGWFDRDAAGFAAPAIAADVLGLVCILLAAVQIVLLVIAMLAFRQAWNVEVERRLDGSQPPPPPPHRGSPLPA
jgi:peptidoglycan/LPS O-acetylase OafA/YrhL